METHGDARLRRVARHVVPQSAEPALACGGSGGSALGGAIFGAVATMVGFRLRDGRQRAAAEAARVLRAQEAETEQQEPHEIRTLDQLRAVLPGSFEMKNVETGLVNEDGTPDAPKVRARSSQSLSLQIVTDCRVGVSQVIDHLDRQMLDFIARSPFVQLGTADSNGLPFVSPKGDAPGFIVAQERAILIPDRPGNNLVMGLQNMVVNPRAGLLFEIPSTTHTLRVVRTISS
jgi:hypothetical protein